MEFYFDGGCKPNPGRMDIGVVCKKLGIAHYEKRGRGTNNQAEWLALIQAVRFARDHGVASVTFIGDSQLVVNQAMGRWQIKNAEMRDLCAEFRNEVAGMDYYVQFVPRERNLAGHLIEAQEGTLVNAR